MKQLRLPDELEQVLWIIGVCGGRVTSDKLLVMARILHTESDALFFKDCRSCFYQTGLWGVRTPNEFFDTISVGENVTFIHRKCPSCHPPLLGDKEERPYILTAAGRQFMSKQNTGERLRISLAQSPFDVLAAQKTILVIRGLRRYYSSDFLEPIGDLYECIDRKEDIAAFRDCLGGAPEIRWLKQFASRLPINTKAYRFFFS